MSAQHTPAVVAAAKALARQHADACNVNVIDLWQFEGETFMEDARKVLEAVAYDALVAALREVVDSHTATYPSAEEGDEAQRKWVHRKSDAITSARAAIAAASQKGE